MHNYPLWASKQTFARIYFLRQGERLVAKKALIMLNFLLKTRQSHCAVYTHMGSETYARTLMVASGAVAKHAYIYPEFAHSIYL